MARLSLTNDGTTGTVEIHYIYVKDNFIVNNNKFNNPKLPHDGSNMETKIVPLLMGSRNFEVMGYIHVEMYSGSDFDTKFNNMIEARSRLINFVSKNEYTYISYPNMGTGYTLNTNDTIQGYLQGLEIRETPTGTPKPSYLMVTFNIIEGKRIGD